MDSVLRKSLFFHLSQLQISDRLNPSFPDTSHTRRTQSDAPKKQVLTFRLFWTFLTFVGEKLDENTKNKLKKLFSEIDILQLPPNPTSILCCTVSCRIHGHLCKKFIIFDYFDGYFDTSQKQKIDLLKSTEISFENFDEDVEI